MSAAVALAVLSALSPGTGFAQGTTWAGTSLRQKLDAVQWRLGLLRINAALSLANVGYDSDIYFGYLDKPVPDFTLSASVPIQLLIPFSKKIVLEVVDTPEYDFYFATEYERAWNNSFQGQFHIAMKKLYLQAGTELANVRERWNPELYIPLREKKFALNGTMLWQVSRQTSLAILGAAEDFDYGDAEFQGDRIADSLNRRENLLDLIAYFQPNPRLRFFMDGQYGAYDFPETEAPTRDSQSYAILGGLELTPKEGELMEAAGVQGILSLGYTWLDIKNPGSVDASGMTGSADLFIELLKKTTGHMFFSRGFQFSIYSGVSYYFVADYGVGIAQRLSRRAVLSYTLSFGRSDYPELETGGGTSGIRNRFTTHTASLEIHLARDLTMSFMGMLGERSLDETSQPQYRNFVGIQLIYGNPPVRIAAPVRRMAR